MSEEKAKKAVEPLFELREYEAELFAPIERRVEAKVEETREAELIPDAGSMIEGIMQPMMMMLTLGMVMPVMQQAMVGVLQSTEVTVIVKPGSIVAVEVQNSVLAVEVKEGQINVTLVDSTIAFPTDVQAATIALPVDIQGQTLNVKIDIAAQSIDKIAIDIAAQSIGNIDVNIATISEAVTFDVKIIDASGVTFNVKITDATGVTFNVAITDATGVTFDVNIAKVDSTITFKVNIANVESSVTFNVKITDVSGVTFNVATASGVTLNIWTPSGKWASVSELMSSASGTVPKIIPAGEELEFFHLTGRGRLMHIGLWAVRGGTDDLIGDTRLRIYVDGESSPSIDLSLEDIDFLNGWLLDHQMLFGFNRMNYGSDYWVCAAQSVNPTGALTWARYDHYHGYYDMAGAFLKLSVEFTSELSIRIYNANAAGGVNVLLAIIYGEYL